MIKEIPPLLLACCLASNRKANKRFPESTIGMAIPCCQEHTSARDIQTKKLVEFYYAWRYKANTYIGTWRLISY